MLKRKIDGEAAKDVYELEIRYKLLTREDRGEIVREEKL